MSSDVPFFLRTVYDYDVISFAKKHYFTTSATSATSTTGRESMTEQGGESRGGNVFISGGSGQSETQEKIQERLGTWMNRSKAEPREEREQLGEEREEFGEEKAKETRCK
jgi:hypothetical protein